MSEPFIVRQGDVLLVSADSIPEDAKPVPRDQGRLVLAYGEVTGHMHQLVGVDTPLTDDDAVMLTTAESATFVRLAKKAQLVHEEHGSIGVPAGTYEVIRQVEYTPWGERRVAD